MEIRVKSLKFDADQKLLDYVETFQIQRPS